jgi:hypothetical protein
MKSKRRGRGKRLEKTPILTMPRRPDAGPFPSRADLIRFLTGRTPLSIHEAARILGWSAARVRRRASADGVMLPGGLVPWTEVAFALFTARPRALVLDTLGDAVDLLPHDLQLTRPAWDVPIYLVRAMEEQARRTQPARAVDDYVADLLHQAIDPRLIESLRRDPLFAAAYDYPEEHEPIQS